jgi:DNA relaxase NicK
MGEVENWFGPLTREREGQGYAENHVAADAPVRVRLGHQKNADRWQVEIPGSAIGYLGDAIKGPVLALIGMGGEFSRLDAAIDWRDPKGLGYMRELAAELNRRSVIRPMGEERQGTGEKTGWTQYFGSRLSDSFVRMYDKGAEQDAGSDWWIRTEAELKGRLARAATALFTPEEDWNVLCRRIVAGQMDSLRYVLPGLYATLFEGEMCQVSVPGRHPALEAYFEWLCVQVGPTLGLLAEQAGVSRLDILRASGMLKVHPSQRRSRHSGLISECREFLRGIINADGKEEVNS